MGEKKRKFEIRKFELRKRLSWSLVRDSDWKNSSEISVGLGERGTSEDVRAGAHGAADENGLSRELIIDGNERMVRREGAS